MPFKLNRMFLFVLGFFLTGSLTAQKIYLNYKDSVAVCYDSIKLDWNIYNEGLLQAITELDSVSIWVLNEDTCLSNEFAGIPVCISCSVAANMVLQTAYKMSYIDNEIIQGSCWDFVNGVYSRLAPGSFKKYDIFSTKKSGPYAPLSMLRPGDWIYHVNYQYYQVEHSAIFICWKDYEKGIAITLSYVGQNIRKTAKFGEFNLNSVYAIFRMEDDFW